VARPRTTPDTADVSEEPPEAQQQTEGQQQQQAEGPPPLERETSSGETEFQRDYLIANALPLTGLEPHVLVGALHGSDQEFLTAEQAKEIAQKWLDSEVAPSEG
jgi:hypothetical protein